jgi:prepilin-type N-terminal cleavage/methylation domain-containing protein
MNTRQHGFTLWELLMTLLVAGIMLGIGVPNILEFQRNSAMTGVANDLVTGVLMARTEAVKRQAPVTLCLSDNPLDANPTCAPGNVNDSATRGFFVFVDENGNFNADGSRNLGDANDGNGVRDAGELVLMQSPAPGGTMRVSTNCGHVSFAPTGFTRQAGGLCFPGVRSVLYCDDRGRRVAAGSLSSARVVQIDRPGRGQVLTETAFVDPVIGALGATCP